MAMFTPARPTVRILDSPSKHTPIRPGLSEPRRLELTEAEKQTLLDNLQLEVTERARKLRAQYALQSQGLRSRLEMRVNRIPKAIRLMKIDDLLQKYVDPTAANPPTRLAGTKRPTTTGRGENSRNDNATALPTKRAKMAAGPVPSATATAPIPRTKVVSVSRTGGGRKAALARGVSQSQPQSQPPLALNKTIFSPPHLQPTTESARNRLAGAAQSARPQRFDSPVKNTDTGRTVTQSKNTLNRSGPTAAKFTSPSPSPSATENIAPSVVAHHPTAIPPTPAKTISVPDRNPSPVKRAGRPPRAAATAAAALSRRMVSTDSTASASSTATVVRQQPSRAGPGRKKGTTAAAAAASESTTRPSTRTTRSRRLAAA